MNKKELIEQLKVAQDNEEIVIILEDSPDVDMDELEPGSVLEITEAGGFVSGLRVIRARAR